MAVARPYQIQLDSPVSHAHAESRILIVEDAPANIQALTAVLRDEGYLLHVATNGRQALEVLGKVRPDLILLDVMMPEMDGFEACTRIKAVPAWRDIPIIFLTAKTETGLPEQLEVFLVNKPMT